MFPPPDGMTAVAMPGSPPGLSRRLRPMLEALAIHPHRAPRALVVGTAGSGKTALLRGLLETLGDDRRAATLLTDAAEVGRFPASHVLIVDDLHLLPADLVADIRRRADDPDAGLIVASRPWPSTDAATTIARRLERAQPAIVLGQVSRADVLDDLASRGRTIEISCVDRILELTDGVTWLVAEAISAHDERDCADDPSHRALSRLLDDRVTHRLDTVDSEVRRLVERRCLVAPTPSVVLSGADEDELTLRAYAEGLLMRGGGPAPAVRSAVRSTASADTIRTLAAELGDDLTLAVAHGDADYSDMLARLHAPGIGDALVQQADRLLASHPQRAQELYDAAWDAGLETPELAARRAAAAWAIGDLDTAAVITEAADEDGDDRRVDLAAAVWAARGMMSQSHALYRAAPPRTPESAARAVVAALGAGDREAVVTGGAATAGISVFSSTLGTAMALLQQGLESTLAGENHEAIMVDLIRAAEMYTSSRSSAPVTELPAVIAAVVAMHLGDTATAESIIDDALFGGHGGGWARPRLLLWRAWIAVQRVRPHEAAAALAQAESEPGARSPRDRLLARAVAVALARRYGDAAQLADAWRAAHRALLRVDIDAFLFLPLGELVCAAAKTGDGERAAQALSRALEVAHGLGDAAIWTTAVHWAGVQRSILLGRPDELIPHARALVAAGHRNAVAAELAKTGRIWTAVLAGSVDIDAVEAAAQQLAAYGMAWDAARLAGHGAARSTDRRASARLLARARELHPIELEQRTAPTPAGKSTRASAANDGGEPSAADELLSEREREVARLVLQGKTYAEIGEAIFISPRTAEHHIAHIRRRLGATSRSDVIAKLRVLMGEPARRADIARPAAGDDVDPHRAA